MKYFGTKILPKEVRREKPTRVRRDGGAIIIYGLELLLKAK